MKRKLIVGGAIVAIALTTGVTVYAAVGEQGFEREKQFSANVAHELKTPLATIITSAQVLKLNDQTTLEEYRENMDITLQSAKRLTEVAEGLLMLCRKDRELSIDVVDSREIFYEIQKELSTLYSDKKLDIKYDLNDFSNANDGKHELLISNLCSNFPLAGLLETFPNTPFKNI